MTFRVRNSLIRLHQQEGETKLIQFPYHFYFTKGFEENKYIKSKVRMEFKLWASFFLVDFIFTSIKNLRDTSCNLLTKAATRVVLQKKVFLEI